MKILLLSELYPPQIGGVEQHVRHLGRELVARGHRVSVATVGGDGADAPAEDDGGVRVYRLRSTTQRASAFAPSGRPYLPPFPDPDIVRALRGLVRRERPDVVHAHNWIVHSFLPLKRSSQARLVMTLHDYSIVCAKRSLLYRERPCSGPGPLKCLHCAAGNYGPVRGPLITVANWALHPWLTRAVDMFVAVSEYVAAGNRLARLSLPYRIVPNFVPDDVAAEADGVDDARLAALPSEPFWLYAGALSRHKGVQVLLAAYDSLPGAPPLVVIGRDSAEAPRDFPRNVTVLRDLPHRAVMAAWKRAALGIIPSLFPDPCPSVAIEAMASGVPLVASRTGGLVDLVDDGVTGRLVTPGDAADLRRALERTMRAPEERERMAGAALRRAPRFMAANVVPQLEQIYAGSGG